MKRQKFIEIATGIEVEAEENENGTISIWEWRSASLITDIDFTYCSMSKEQFEKLYEKI